MPNLNVNLDPNAKRGLLQLAGKGHYAYPL